MVAQFITYQYAHSAQYIDDFFLKIMVVLRTGALHPLPDFSGCTCTRCTRSNAAPAEGKSAATPLNSLNPNKAQLYL